MLSLTDAMFELLKAFEDAANDARGGVVVLTGAGDKAFCTGRYAKEAVTAVFGQVDPAVGSFDGETNCLDLMW